MIEFIIIEDLEIPKTIHLNNNHDKIDEFIDNYIDKLLPNFLMSINREDSFRTHNIGIKYGNKLEDTGEFINKFILLAEFINNKVYKFTGKYNFYESNKVNFDLRLELRVKFYTTVDGKFDSGLELLKIKVKDSLLKVLKDSKCIWISDDQVIQLSKECYKDINKVENELRALINIVMIDIFGYEWKNLIIHNRINKTYKDSIKGYKEAVPTFEDVDDFLISLDARQLKTIMTSNITKEVLGRNSISLNNSVDLWESVFKDYLNDSFKDKWGEMCDLRNQIAHNKLIDSRFRDKVRKMCKEILDDIKDARDECIIMKSKDMKHSEYFIRYDGLLIQPINKKVRFQIIKDKIKDLFTSLNYSYGSNEFIKIEIWLDEISMDLNRNKPIKILCIQKKIECDGLDIECDDLGIERDDLKVPNFVIYNKIIDIYMCLDNTFIEGIRPKFQFEIIKNGNKLIECILAHNGYDLLTNLPDRLDILIEAETEESIEKLGSGWNDFVHKIYSEMQNL